MIFVDQKYVLCYTYVMKMFIEIAQRKMNEMFLDFT